MTYLKLFFASANLASLLLANPAQAAMPTALASGFNHHCALTTSNGVLCWGGGTLGQLGNGVLANSLVPVAVNGLSSGVTALAGGYQHSCALLGNGTVQCWGRNDYGQLGNGAQTNSATPVAVSGLSGVVAIAAGTYHSCAVLASGAAKCWGYNGQGGLGDGTTTTPRLTPVTVLGVSGATGISGGLGHSCALLGSGKAQCWGTNSYGQLGNGTVTGSTTRVDVVGLLDAQSIQSGQYHNCVKTTAGAAKCWGRNDYGQIGNGTTTNALSPVTVLGSGVVQVNAQSGGGSSCARLSDGSALCWGFNSSAQLGTGSTGNKTLPTPVTIIGTPMTSISIGGNSGCALVAGGAQCWGNNSTGQHGAGNTNSVSLAQNVTDLFGSAPALAPQGISPVTSSTPIYTWKAIPGSTGYRLRINGVATSYSAAAANCPDGIGLCTITGSSLAPGAYSWDVQGYNSYGNGAWSVPLSFSL